MLTAFAVLLRAIGLACCGHRAVALENLALRQQLGALKRHVKRPTLRRRDRLFWIVLAKTWPTWRTALIVVRPDTVVRWHRQWFRRRWTQRSQQKRPGRPRTAAALRALVIEMGAANPLWGAPRIHGELLKLGIEVDFFTVPTLTGHVLFVFVLLAHQRRRIVHFTVTEHPTAAWTAQQIIEAFPDDTAPRWLLRDRDAIFGEVFRRVSPAWAPRRSSQRRRARGKIRTRSG